jgi:hypothetical protein
MNNASVTACSFALVLDACNSSQSPAHPVTERTQFPFKAPSPAAVQRVMDEHDSTFGEAGRVGVWTKAASVTSLDDLRAEPL